MPTLLAFRDHVNSGISYSGRTVTVTLTADPLSVTGWNDPVGTADNPFKGTFQGNNHLINLSGKTGLFGVTDGATIENVTLVASIENTDDNAKVVTNSALLENAFDLETGQPKDGEVYDGGYGGIVNYAKNSTIQNCAVTGSIQYNNSNNVGGIVGRMETTSSSSESKVKNCDVTADINGHRCTGGIVGAIYGNGTATIENCGFMVNSDQFPSASAEMTANLFTGGIVGLCLSPAVISKCFNHVKIGENSDVKAGIVGIAQAQNSGTITIESCYNTGEVDTSDQSKYAGGIVGVAYNTAISYCYNSGTIKSPLGHGGIAALATKSKIEYCYNVGTISSDGPHGPIISSAISNEGTGFTPTITNCYYLSSTANNSSYIGGAISKAKDAMNSWNLHGSEFLGTGSATETTGRYWVFVRENYPLLYEVRGQEISLKGNSGRNKTSSDVNVYATFSSDVAFTCDEAYWAQRIDTYYGTKIFVFQQTSILYPSVGENYQKGYMLRTTNNTTEFKLVYRPTTEIGRVVNRYLNYKPFNYVTGEYGEEVPNTETTICEENFMYGVGKKTSYNNLYKDDRTIFYLSGNTVGNDTYAVFKKLTPNNSSSIGDNKTYLLANPNELSVEGSAKTMFNISFNEFVEPEAVLLGDVDVDGAVTITDVVKMVNVVLNESADDVIMKHGDVNGDGDLDVADVVAIVNKVLGVENDVKSRKVNSVANGSDEASLELNDGVVDFLLSNSSAFCAFQFYMSAEDGLDCEKIILSARAKGHTVSMNKLTDGRYKVMCYSGVNKSFEGSEGELFNILTSGASGKLTLEDLFFVTPGASKVKFGNMDIDVVPTGISGIDADEKANTIFDLSGRRVQKVQKGVYIVNGKKVIL
ncbi:MAG: hypothetical protein J6T52_13650 [Bacteroidaceae bacterium]|nr:hypothetical protein [Bacteroidaceae bacterium]